MDTTVAVQITVSCSCLVQLIRSSCGMVLRDSTKDLGIPVTVYDKYIGLKCKKSLPMDCSTCWTFQAIFKGFLH